MGHVGIKESRSPGFEYRSSAALPGYSKTLSGGHLVKKYAPQPVQRTYDLGHRTFSLPECSVSVPI
ncbi:MAG: hypothetical protein ACM34E_04425, partial [Acidobacteriota bacterium]